MDPQHIHIIIGSTRQGRRGEPVARWFADIAERREDIRSEVGDLAYWDLPFLTTPVPPAMAAPTDPLTQKWAEHVGRADGYVFVTPEYNHGYPAALKNAIDHVFHPWNRKPVGFVAYGGPGGAKDAGRVLDGLVWWASALREACGR